MPESFIMKLLSVTIIFFSMLFMTATETVALDHTPSPELTKLLKKIEKASNPDNTASKITNQVFIFETEMAMAKVKFTSKTILKAPDKRKMVVTIPNVMTETQVFDGKEGWQINSSMGFQQITGPALNFLKYSTISGNQMLLEDKYAKIELAKEKTEINGMQCSKLTCYPPSKYQLKPHSGKILSGGRCCFFLNSRCNFLLI